MDVFETFKEFSIGGLSKDRLIEELEAKGIQFNKYASTLFEHPNFVSGDKIDLVKVAKVKLSDFGLSNPCSYQELVSRTAAFGLRPCPLYLAAYLRLEYLDQPEGPYLTICSDKPESDEDFPNGFYIRNHEGSLWLRGYRADDFCEWPNNNEFIFLE